MAGFDNEVVYSLGNRLELSTAQSIYLMQQQPTDVSIINYTGNPNTFVSANPSSICHDASTGDIWIKASGTGNTGWQLLIGASSLTITGTSGGALSPDGAGNWSLLGNSTASGTVPVSTTGVGSTLTFSVQKAQAVSSSNPAMVGLSSFKSTDFTVDANGFVSLVGGGASSLTITGTTGGAISPDGAGNWNISGSGSTVTSGAGNTLSVALTGLTNHAILVGDGTSTIKKLALGTAKQVLQSGGASSDPVFSTATYPSIAGTTGTILRSNGTNWVNTTATYPTTTAINQILYSSSANVIGQIPTAVNKILSTNNSGVPSMGTSLDNDYIFTGYVAGGNRTVTVENTNNTSPVSHAYFVAQVNGTNSGDPYFRCNVGSTRSYAIGIDNSESQSYVVNTNSDGIVGTSTGQRIQMIDSGGNRTLPKNSCVLASLITSVTNATGNGTVAHVIFDGDGGYYFDQNNNYDIVTGYFTAPATGKYFVSAAVTFTGLNSSHTLGSIIIEVNSIGYAVNQFNPWISVDSSNEFTAHITCIVPMSINFTSRINAYVAGGTKTVGFKGYSYGAYTRVSYNLIS